MKQKTKQLQSSGETRKTNRTWHFLRTLNSLLLSKLLLLLIIPAIGSTAAWAATESISWAITTNQLTITPTITPSVGAKLSNASTTIELQDFKTTSSSKSGYCLPFYKTAVDFDATKNFAKISFVVADGYTFTPTSLGMTVFSYGTGNLKYKVVISDSKAIATSVTSNEIQPSSDHEAAITFADGAFTGKTFEGTVTIKLYAYNYANSTTSKRTYIKSPITISGTTAAKTSEGPYTVTYTAGDGGTCAKSSDTYTGSALTLPTVTPKTVEYNYQKVFKGWYTASSGGTRVGGADDPYTPSGNIELFAQYDTKYYITTSVAPEGGGAAATIVASGTPISSNGSYVMEGTEITVTAGAANSGYAWNRWSVGTNRTPSSFNYTVDNPKSYIANYTTNTAITPATYEYNVGATPSTITYSPTLSPAGDGDTYQWYKNSTNSAAVDNEHKITGATSATLAAANIDTSSEGTTYYYCVVTPTYENGGTQYGTPATSNIVTVSVVEATPTTYSVTYNGNGNTSGSVPTDDKAYTSGNSVTVKTNSGTLAKTGYNFAGWNTRSDGTGTDYAASGLASFSITANTTLYAKWTAKTYTITLNKNGGSAGGSATATFNSNKLTSISAPTYSGKVVEGYYKEAGCTTKIADASGNLVASVDGYTDGSGNWIKDGTATLYAQWEDAPAGDTSLPVTYNFADSDKWSESGNFISAGSTTLTNKDNTGTHSITFRASGGDKFNMTTGTKLSMRDNASKNNYIAIPISGIKGRIDIDVWAPYSSTSGYKLKYTLDTSNGTTPIDQPSGLDTKKSPNKYVDAEGGYFNFRIKDITATSGVLYFGRGEAGFPDFYQIRITTEDAYIEPEKKSVTLGDAQVDTIAVKNNTSYNVRIKTTSDPTIATSWYLPAENRLAITAVAPGNTSTVIFVDKDGNGEENGDESTTEQTITITVNGITDITTPNSAVYDTSGGSASPSLDDISITATHSSGAKMAYQWYKNTVNSNEGGTAISGATGQTLAKEKIGTSATEDASFYYCVVSSAGCKSKASDVAYVLTSKTKRYFQMSNVAGNKETSATEENITGQIIAGGKAFVENTADDTYRYITRPNSSTAHTYVAGNSTPSTHNFKVVVDKLISTGDVIFIQLNGLGSSTPRGVYLRSAANVTTNQVELKTAENDGIITKTYTVTSSDCLHGQNTFYIVGVSGADYFTDLVIGKAADLTVGAPTPATQTVQQNDAATPISVTVSGGTGTYTYQWYSNDENSADVGEGHKIDGATSASYTPPTTTADTKYYYCRVNNSVTSATASVTVNPPSHGWHTPTFTNSVEVYALTKTNFEAQPASSSSKFWTMGSVSYTDATIAPVSEDEAKYMKLGSSNTLTFYVKNAIAFDVIAGDGSNTSRNAKIKVGDTQVGSLVNNQKWTDKFSLNADGDKITIYSANNTITLGGIRFYMYSPIEVRRGETVLDNDTIYRNDGAVAYDVTSSRPGTLSVTKPGGATGSDNDYTSSIAHVQFVPETGTLTVTPSALGTETITIAQAASGDYPAITREFTVVVAKHTLKLDFTLDNIDVSAAILTNNTSIPAGSLPTLHYYLDGVATTLSDLTSKSITVNFMTDDPTIAYFDNNSNGNYDGESEKVGTAYTLTYGGGQGGAQIYAYAATSANYTAAKDFFGLNIKKGTFNKIGEGEEVDVQEQFVLQDNNGADVVTLTYGGYRYLTDSQKQDYDNQWHKATTKSTQTDVGSKTKEIVYDIDGYKNYTRHKSDALNEYDFQLKGMSDDYTKPNCPNGMWYKTSELKPDGTTPYGEYERIRPFALPCKGGYLKFDIHQTGTLTVYVWQNGSMNEADKTLGSKPRLGYWFDQDGWVKHPKVAPITKQPITKKSYGRDVFCDALKSEAKLEAKWTNGDAEIVPMLLRKYCDNAANPKEYYAESGPALNPYYWKTQAEIETNLNEEATIIPEKIRPVPFHNGYTVPQNSYLKYVIDVVAGKTYYFYGMMTKIGYVGMNFIPDNTVADVEEVASLHLTDEDNMAKFVSDRPHAYTVYNEVTLRSRFRKEEWATICLPFALSENQVEEAFGKGTQLTLYNGLIKKGTDYTIKYLSHVDRNILPGQPYFIKPSGVDAHGDDLANDGKYIGSTVEGAEGTRITFNTVVIDRDQFNMATCSYGSNQNVDASGADLGEAGYVFTGSTYNDELLPYSYVMNAGLLRRYTTSKAAGSRKKIPTYMAYLKPNTSAAQSGSMSFTADFSEENIEKTWETSIDDNPTGISIVDADAENGGRMLNNGKVYNMMGQEIDPSAAKGIVIINGKKVMY